LAAEVRFSSDTSVTRDIINCAEMHSNFTDVYFYQFSYDGIMGNVTISLDGAEHDVTSRNKSSSLFISL
jgi:carboxylesterase type B